MGDADRLEQVLYNLVDNAIKFTPDGERVLVAVTMEEVLEKQARLHFKVTDTGIGMSEEQVKRLFQPFYQGDGSSTRKVGGAGLGLSVSRHLVKLMGGTLQVESTLGAGSLFSFELSLKRSAHQAATEIAVDDLHGRRALVVDDNAGAREIFKDMLENLGATAMLVASGEEALAVLRDRDGGQTGFDFVLMDWRMPGMDGIETAQAMAQDPALAELPVILVSAFGRERAQRAADALKLAGICQKPLTPTELLTMAAKALTPLEAVTPEASDASETAPAWTPEEQQTLADLLEGWIQLLDQGNAQAANRLPEMRERLGATFRRPLDRAARQMADYDFDEASETVAGIRERVLGGKNMA